MQRRSDDAVQPEMHGEFEAIVEHGSDPVVLQPESHTACYLVEIKNCIILIDLLDHHDTVDVRTFGFVEN